MQARDRFRLILGIALVLAGGWLLAVRIYPPLEDLIAFTIPWPLYLVIAGGAILLLGVLSGSPGAAVPATIVAGIGGIFYWQNISGDWSSWSYMWTLIPGFVGLGTLLAGILGENRRENLRRGANLLLVSLVLWIIFAYLLGAGGLLQAYWPVLLIVLGLWLLIRSLASPMKSTLPPETDA